MEDNNNKFVLEKKNMENLFNFEKIKELLKTIFGVNNMQLLEANENEYHLLNFNKLCVVFHKKIFLNYQKIEGVHVLERKKTTRIIFDEEKTKSLKRSRHTLSDECVHKPLKKTLLTIYSKINDINKSLKEMDYLNKLRNVKDKVDENSKKIENLSGNINSLMIKYHGIQLIKDGDVIDTNDIKSFILYTIYDVFDDIKKKDHNQKYIEYHKKLKKNVKKKQKKIWKAILQIERYINKKIQEISNSDILIEDIEKDCNIFLTEKNIKEKFSF